jgi:hypothetical protein
MIDLLQRIYTSLRTSKFCTHQESFASFASQTCQSSQLDVVIYFCSIYDIFV